MLPDNYGVDYTPAPRGDLSRAGFVLTIVVGLISLTAALALITALMGVR